MVAAGLHPPTLAARRAGNATIVAVLLNWALLGATTRLPSVRARSPWNDNPFDLMLSITGVLTVLLAVVTWPRLAVHGGPAPAPRHAVRSILTGSAALLGCVATADLTCLAAVLVASDLTDLTYPSWDAVLIGLVTLLAAGALACGSAVRLLVRARTAAADPTRPSGVAGPDLLDDLATLAARIWPGSVASRTLAWLVRPAPPR